MCTPWIPGILTEKKLKDLLEQRLMFLMLTLSGKSMVLMKAFFSQRNMGASK
jgi:hypothetical protein